MFPAFAMSLIMAAGSLARGTDLPPSFTVDLPFEANRATPIWLGTPEAPPSAFATLTLPITAPDPNASLLVTVYFEEKQGGFLRINWQSGGFAQTLSDNFYEGIGMGNQRSLLLPPQILQGGGTLNFQCGDTVLGIERIKLEWVADRAELVSAATQNVLVVAESGRIQAAQDLNGQPVAANSPEWHNRVVTVPITDSAQRIEQGVEFSVQIDEVPTLARIALKEDGLAWGQRLLVWVNGQPAGTLTPEVPDLNDEGFLLHLNAPDHYLGWRGGSLLVPVTLLKPGENTLQFSTMDDLPKAQPADAATPAATSDPLAVKEVVLQLGYTTPPAVTTAADPSSTPATSDSTSSTPTSYDPSTSDAVTPDSSTPTGLIPATPSTETP